MKDTYIRVRCTTEQKNAIKAAAKRNRKNMSEYILNVVCTAIVKGNNYENSVLNELTVGEFLEIYSEKIQDKMSEELHYRVENGYIYRD